MRIASTIFVGAVLLLGLVFRAPFVGKVWAASSWWAASFAAASVSMLCLGSTLRLTSAYRNPETGSQLTWMHPLAATPPKAQPQTTGWIIQNLTSLLKL